jgi:hypothetical protein
MDADDNKACEGDSGAYKELSVTNSEVTIVKIVIEAKMFRGNVKVDP